MEMDQKRADMIVDIQKALASARAANDESLVEHFLEMALAEAIEPERKTLPANITEILRREP